MTTLFKDQGPAETIVGSGLYVIPEGYFAKVSYLEGYTDMYINNYLTLPTSATPVGFTFDYRRTTNTTGFTDYTVYTATSAGVISGTVTASAYVVLGFSGYHFLSVEILVGGVIVGSSGSPLTPYTTSINVSSLILQGQSVVVRVYSYYSVNAYTNDWEGRGYGTLNFSPTLAKPVTGNTILKAGDTIQGGAYILSIYEV